MKWISVDTKPMKSFLSFITEDTLLFHKDIGIPDNLLRAPLAGMPLRYGRHAQQAAMDDGLYNLPSKVPSSYTVFEVESTNGRASKWGVRFTCDERPTHDMCVVFLPDGFVKTIWLNAKTDKHKTLKRWLYANPSMYRSH